MYLNTVCLERGEAVILAQSLPFDPKKIKTLQLHCGVVNKMLESEY